MEYNGKPVWTEDNFEFEKTKIGDYVDAQVVMNAMNCMPPALMRLSCAQLGEPYSHREDPVEKKFRPTFATFKCVKGDFNDGVWIYCGHCFLGETKERGKDPAYV